MSGSIVCHTHNTPCSPQICCSHNVLLLQSSQNSLVGWEDACRAQVHPMISWLQGNDNFPHPPKTHRQSRESLTMSLLGIAQEWLLFSKVSGKVCEYVLCCSTNHHPSPFQNCMNCVYHREHIPYRWHCTFKIEVWFVTEMRTCSHGIPGVVPSVQRHDLTWEHLQTFSISYGQLIKFS